MNGLETISMNLSEKLKLNLAKAYNNRVKTHFKKCDFEKAIADYTKAIELNLQDADVYYTRGKLYDEGRVHGIIYLESLSVYENCRNIFIW